MTPQNQTRPHPNGDCVRACIATLLDLPIAEVPDWLLMRQDGDDAPDKYPTWFLEMQDFLRKRGYAFVEIQLERKTWMPLPFEAWAIFIGTHPTGARHAIVGKCLDSLFVPMHDPLGGDAAIAFVNGRVDAVCFLVPLDPVNTKFKSAEDRRALRAARDSANEPVPVVRCEHGIEIGGEIECQRCKLQTEPPKDGSPKN